MSAPDISLPPAGRSGQAAGLSFFLAAAWCLAGLAASLYLFHPGIATYDALSVYEQAGQGGYGDWQPPLFGVLWHGLETVFGPGPQAIVLPALVLYWLSFYLIFHVLRRAGSRLAWLALVLPLAPPLIALQGIVWRDSVFSTLWLFAFALAFFGAEGSRRLRAAATATAIAALLLGFWLRPNALFAAAPLAVYILWPGGFRWKRILLLTLPLCIALQASAHLVNYTWLQATPRHPAHSILVFDLTGIGHFAGRNVFPVDDWTPEEVRRLTTSCYDPAYWDAVWWLRDDCSFVMRRLDSREEGKRLFGSPKLVRAWLAAVRDNPGAYARHRLTHFGTLLFGRIMVLFEHPTAGMAFHFTGNTAYAAYRDAMLGLKRDTPVFLGIVWFCLVVFVALGGTLMRDGRAKAAVLGLSQSGTIFMLTYLPMGVAAEYRYFYWTVMCGLVGGLVMAGRWVRPGSDLSRS